MQYAQTPVLYVIVDAVFVLFITLVYTKLKVRSYSIRIFRVMLLTSCLLLVMDALWELADVSFLQCSNQAKHAIYALFFCVSGPAGYFCFLYSQSIFHSRLSKRFLIFSALPLFILALLLVFTAKNGWIFHVNSDGSFVPGSLYPLALVLTYGYITAALIFALINLQKPSIDYSQKKKNIDVMSIPHEIEHCHRAS